MGIALIVVLGVILLANQVNDTWEDTHWGGDVGEEEYSETRSEDGTGQGDVCNTGVCGTGYIFGFVVPSYIIIRWKDNFSSVLSSFVNRWKRNYE